MLFYPNPTPPSQPRPVLAHTTLAHPSSAVDAVLRHLLPPRTPTHQLHAPVTHGVALRAAEALDIYPPLLATPSSICFYL